MSTKSGCPRTLTGARRRGGVCAAAFLFALGVSAAVSAQQPAGASLTGVVRDATSGDPVSGALISAGERGPRAIADPEGRFRITGLPLGGARIRVERFGYTRLEVAVDVTGSNDPLELRMSVDPVQLQGLTVTGGARAALGGSVLDALTGAPVPWASLWLSRDAVREVSRATADGQGVFVMEDVETGSYLLRVERLGYLSQYVPHGHLAPPAPVEVRLEPDSAVTRGLAVMTRELAFRRNAAAYTVRSYGEEALRLSAAPSVRAFLDTHAFLNFEPCASGRGSCMVVAGRLSSPSVFIDEMHYIDGLDVLWSYDPDEIHSVEVFRCRTPQIRIYTIAYMARMAMRPRILTPICLAD